MLAGVGGRTIAEAQERISVEEFRRWVHYRNLRGSFHVGQRVEWAVSVLCAMYGNVHRTEGTPIFGVHDFATHHDAPPITLERAMQEWH